MLDDPELGVGPADLAFVNGTILTMDANARRSEAVVVRGDRIIAVGNSEEAQTLIGPRTDVVDLNGRTLIPAFQDCHVHPFQGGLERLRCNLAEAHSKQEYFRLIRQYADDHPKLDWILGGGWSIDVFGSAGPDATMLDAIVPDRPVFLPNRDHHGAWVNTVALRLAGVDDKTADPADGRLQRTLAGRPTGLLHEGAMKLVSRMVPAPSWDDQVSAIRSSQKYLHSLGIATWQDAIVGMTQNQVDNFPVYSHLAENGELTATVVGSLWWDRHGGAEQIDGLAQRREQTASTQFRPTTVKIGVDGICENFTASMLEPYLGEDGEPTTNRGMAFFDPEQLAEHVVALDALGFQVHFHAIGDRAVRDALDAVEAARRRNGFKDTRPHIAHIQVIHPADIPRFESLSVLANGQPLWATYEPQMTEATIPFLGPERTEWQYPFGSLSRAGAIIGFGSDWPVSSPNPLWGIHVAVNRTAPAGYLYADNPRASAEPFLPGERLDLGSALAAYTTNAAFLNHLEGESGTIEVGKRADLTILSQDLFEVEQQALSSVEVLMTVAGGRVVFASAAFG